MPDAILRKLPTTSARLLAMAIALLSEAKKVRDHMKFSDAELTSILAGDRELTWAELDVLITLLVEEQATLIAQNRDLRELVSLLRTHRK